MTTKGAAAAVAVAWVASALGAGGLVADGTVLVGVRKPAPTPTAVATRGAEEPLPPREYIAGGDSQYAASIGNTVHLSPPAKMDRWLLRGVQQRALLIQEIKSIGIHHDPAFFVVCFTPPRCNG